MAAIDPTPTRQHSLRVMVTHLWRWATHDPHGAQAQAGTVRASVTIFRSDDARADRTT